MTALLKLRHGVLHHDDTLRFNTSRAFTSEAVRTVTAGYCATTAAPAGSSRPSPEASAPRSAGSAPASTPSVSFSGRRTGARPAHHSDSLRSRSLNAQHKALFRDTGSPSAGNSACGAPTPPPPASAVRACCRAGRCRCPSAGTASRRRRSPGGALSFPRCPGAWRCEALPPPVISVGFAGTLNTASFRSSVPASLPSAYILSPLPLLLASFHTLLHFDVAAVGAEPRPE